MADKIEQQELETDTGGSKEKTDYGKILENINKERPGDKEAEEAQKKAEELLKQVEGEETKSATNKETDQKTENVSQWTAGEQRQKEHPGEVNANRLDAGKSLIDEVNTPQSNSIAKGLQWIIKKLGGF